ncbi:MAG: DUF4976 domain-containing protein, partial [Verrucomicrobiota bacterium]|nr:DUF4976 domain-containing protein [Verrucomicrobiota bacterium]
LAGKSFRPLLENPQAEWNLPAYTQQVRNEKGSQIMGYSVRTERWRYTEWDGGKQGSELYDHDADPHEWHNLANDPKQAKTIGELKILLQKIGTTKIPAEMPKKKNVGKRNKQP